MKRIALLSLLYTLVLSSSTASAGNVSICHYSAEDAAFHVIAVSAKAVAKHFQNHGDSYPAAYWIDADGDGYGDAGGATDVCPNSGFVANADDCNDQDGASNPGASESCGDGIDNNCDGLTDDNCSACDTNVTQGTGCYWMENFSGNFCFIPAGNASDINACFALDSCSGGLGYSGGGCYKWADCSNCTAYPWN